MDHDDRTHTRNAGTQTGYMKLAGVDDREYDALADLFLGGSELAPAPSRNTPKAAPVPDPAVSAMDLLGDLQMHIDDASVIDRSEPFLKTPDRGIGSVPCIEAVLLGHLPVRASLWVRQYACSTARRRGEVVALIRAAAGSTSVDLISGTEGIESRECASLHEALVRVHHVADRVILRVDETTEPELLDRDEIDEITILTGADEAAVVSSYRLIKTLTSVWDSDEVIGTPHLRLAVMGATGQQAAEASAKLTRAVDAFLDRPIEIIDAAGRIDATGTTNIYRDTVAHQATDILDELIEIGCGVHSPAPVQPLPQADMQINALIAPVASITEPAMSIEPVPSTKRVMGRLGPMIKGLSTLETRCPFALDVELCVDAKGGLHLVTDDRHDRPMTRIETVRAWVRDHLLLILRAEPKLAMPDANDRSAEIGLHLISDDPHTLRGLIDSPVRVYAFAEVSVADQRMKIATPIN